jgi:hypothetical protein
MTYARLYKRNDYAHDADFGTNPSKDEKKKPGLGWKKRLYRDR